MSATAPTPMVDHDALPAGTRFSEFEILRVLGVGGFGIVYLAMDHSLQRHVALKEYMPAALASRGQGPQITVRSGSFAETYAIGLRSFVNEARLLARFDHPSLVKVYRFWEDNATAYMVMPYLQGSTLREARRAMTQPPSEAWIRGVLDPLLGALEQLHREGVYHRDIAPDNIVLPPNGPPVLLDFGAARHVIGDRTQSLTAILKPSYAPIEQYAEMTQLRQGPWTDLYALGAVMHFVLTGAPPAPATARAVQDDAQPLEDRNIPGVSARFMAAVSWMLSVRPQARPQSVEALRAALDGRADIPMRARFDSGTPAAALTPTTAFEPTIRVGSVQTRPAQADAAHQPTVRMAPLVPAVAAPPAREPGVAVAPALPPRPQPSATASTPSVPAAATVAAKPAEASSKRGLVLAAVGAAVILAAAALWQFGGQRGTADPASAATGSSAIRVSNPPASLPAVAVPAAPVAAAVNVASAPAAAAEPSPLAKDNAATLPSAPPVKAVERAKPVLKPPPRRAEPMPEPALAHVERKPPELAAPAAVAADTHQRPATPLVRETAAVASAVATTVTAAADGPATAREICGKRVFISLAICMERECQLPRFRNHPDCVKVLEIKSRREQ